jgi:hypothetical protein
VSWVSLTLLVAIAGIFGLSLLLRHWDPMPLEFPSPQQYHFRVEVLNGSGRTGVAARVAEQLRSRGLDVVYVGNAPSFGFDETLIIDRVGCADCALTVAEAVGFGTVTEEVDSLRLVEVSVILGADLMNLQGG